MPKAQIQQQTPFADQKTLEKQYPEQEQRSKLMQAFDTWQQSPTPQNAEPLLSRLKPTIDSALHTYGGGAQGRLATRAELIALEAARTYDPKKDAKLTTHVYNHLQSLQRERAKRDNLVHLPENVILEKNRIRKAEKDFISRYGREPSKAELADKTGLSVKRLTKLSAYQPTTHESSMLSEKGDALYPQAPQDPTRIWIDYVYYDLDPVDQKILEWCTGYGGTKKLSKKEIAERLKISAPAISSRINKIVRKIEEGANV